ncbi:MAG: hypothetical protein J7507_01875 [Pseudoxanthomonas sp.]|nr:hypothetical protein [Pseudoxanthomonas sp.]
MKKPATVVLPLILAMLAPCAGAQSISPAWEAYRNRNKQPTAEPAPAQADADAPSDAQPAAPANAPASGTPVSGSATPTTVSSPSRSYARRAEPQGGFFVGAQAGKGWIYEDVDQNVVAINGGYRWQAGDVSLIGIELASGRLAETDDGGWNYAQVDYGSIGANARFNFGEGNPWFAIARLGYWVADGDGDEDGDVDGGYASFGIGVDVNRNFNVNLMYTNHAYATTYYYSSGYEETEINRADMVTLGVEARF